MKTLLHGMLACLLAVSAIGCQPEAGTDHTPEMTPEQREQVEQAHSQAPTDGAATPQQ